MSLTMPSFRLIPSVAVALFSAMLLVSCGRKDSDVKEEGDTTPSAATTPASETVSARPEQADASPAGKETASQAGQESASPPATEEEKSAASTAATELMKTRRDSLRRLALATEKLASRTRALEKSDDPAIQAAIKLVQDRQQALEAAKATVEAAAASLAEAEAERDKAFATDTVWAEFKAEMDAVEKEEADLRARLQLQMANAHKRGFHIKPPVAPESPSSTTNPSSRPE